MSLLITRDLPTTNTCLSSTVGLCSNIHNYNHIKPEVQIDGYSKV